MASLLGELESLRAPLDRSTAGGLGTRTAHEVERLSAVLRAVMDARPCPETRAAHGGRGWSV